MVPHVAPRGTHQRRQKISYLSPPVVPNITSFTTTPKSNLSIGGTPYNVQTAGKSYSLTEPEDHTLRFEIQPGDRAWFDTGSTVDRCEVQSDQLIPIGSPANIAYKFMLEPGAANTASWFVTAEMHNDDGALGTDVHTSPPLAIEVNGEHLQVVARYCPTEFSWGRTQSNPVKKVAGTTQLPAICHSGPRHESFG